VKPIEGRIRRRRANVVRTRKNGQRRHCDLGELPAARQNRLRRCRQSSRLAAFGLRQRKWLANNSRWSRWGSRQTREVFLELTGYIVGVPICRLEIHQRRNLIAVLHRQITHFLACERMTDEHRLLEAQRVE